MSNLIHISKTDLSDFYKDAFGFRPRGHYQEWWTEEELQKEYDYLSACCRENREMEAILEGRLPFNRGELDSEWTSGEKDSILFQLNNTLYLFELIDVPSGSRIRAGMLQDSGLHTRNHGGVRLRIESPRTGNQQEYNIQFTVIGRRP